MTLPGTDKIAERIDNAYAHFADVLMEAGGINAEAAAAVTREYLRLRVATLDPVAAVIRVKHGAFLDRDVITRAVETAEAR